VADGLVESAQTSSQTQWWWTETKEGMATPSPSKRVENKVSAARARGENEKASPKRRENIKGDISS